LIKLVDLRVRGWFGVVRGCWAGGLARLPIMGESVVVRPDQGRF